MKTPRPTFLILINLLLLSTLLRAQSHSSEADLAALAEWLPGTYSSEAQAKQEPGYAPLLLRVFPIWPDSAGGRWFYEEQAGVRRPDKPLRRHVIQLKTAEGGYVVAHYYKLKETANVRLGWEETSPEGQLRADDLEAAPAYRLFYRRLADGTFRGTTEVGGCATSQGNACFFTQESLLSNNCLINWERGWSNDFELMWGPATHGYRFDKLRKDRVARLK